ncbi:MAG: response regulator, partial [Desulfobulbaceae bacterium]|nr:response regulator [Desulfobulbaceae bacterium]
MGKTIEYPENTNIGTSMDKCVLVVDDNEGLNNLVQKALSRAGFDTQGVLTGADAIERVMADSNLILLLDQQLPDMTGTELIRTLVERDRQVPFVTMTGHGDEKIAVEMMKLGAKDYLVKGVGLTDLLPAVFGRVFRELETQRQLVLAEEELQRREERYKQLFNSGNDAVFVHAVGEEGPEQFTEVNDVACKQLGYCREELLKMSPVDIDGEGMSRDRHQALEKLSTTGQCVFEMVHRSKSGEKIPVEISSSVFASKGTRFVLSIARDITARKRAEQLLRDSENRLQQALKMESIGTLAGGIAHDFNNILFPIVGNTEMLLEDIPEDSPLRNNLNAVFEGALRAKELVKQILAFSRQDSHEIKLMRMQPIIKDALKLIRSTIPTSIEI